MTILGLDPSTKSTGVAIFEDKKLIFYDCITSNNPNLFIRIHHMVDELDKILQKYTINYVYIEDVIPEDVKHNQQVFSALKYLQGFILDLLNTHKISHEFFVASQWRKQCGIKTGRGVYRESLKAKSIAFVKEQFNITVNDDIADAICIGHTGMSFFYANNDDFELI